jgi:hypothetical protein
MLYGIQVWRLWRPVHHVDVCVLQHSPCCRTLSCMNVIVWLATTSDNTEGLILQQYVTPTVTAAVKQILAILRLLFFTLITKILLQTRLCKEQTKINYRNISQTCWAFQNAIEHTSYIINKYNIRHRISVRLEKSVSIYGIYRYRHATCIYHIHIMHTERPSNIQLYAYTMNNIEI